MPDIPQAPVPIDLRDVIADRRAALQHYRTIVESLELEIKALETRQALTGGTEASTTGNQMQSESAGARASAAQIDKKHADHKFVQMLVRRKLSVRDIAEFLTAKLKREVPRQTVQTWYKRHDDPAYRPIPEDAAVALKDEYAVPILAWHRIRQPKA